LQRNRAILHIIQKRCYRYAVKATKLSKQLSLQIVHCLIQFDCTFSLFPILTLNDLEQTFTLTKTEHECQFN